MEGERPKNERWINTEQQRYSDLRNKNKREKSDKLADAKWLRCVQENAFISRCDLINNLISNNGSIESLLRDKSSLELKYETICSGNMNVVLQLNGDDSEDSWMAYKYDEYVKVMDSI